MFGAAFVLKQGWSRCLILLLIVFAGGLALTGCDSRPVTGGPNGGTNPPPQPPPQPPPPPVLCPLCGRQLAADAETGHRPVILMIDNHPRARPQSGLTEACTVFEILAEGGITRLLPVYLHGEPEQIGPVRSTRHYFLDIAAGLDSLFAHAGQSPQGAVDLKQLAIASLDEFRHDKAYWRDTSRQAPHNLYTTLAKLRTAAASVGLAIQRPADQARWPYRSGDAGVPGEQLSQGPEVVWPFSAGKYVVGFHYQAADEDDLPGQYERRINGMPHIDAVTGEPLRATSVVVVYARFWRIPNDPEGRLGAELTGSGDALVFRQGAVYEAAWRKANRTSPIVLLDGAGEHVILDAGQTWILIVPLETEVRRLSVEP